MGRGCSQLGQAREAGPGPRRTQELQLCWSKRRDWAWVQPHSPLVPSKGGDTTRPHTLNSPSWNAVCRKESSKSRHRPSAQHWGSPPTTSSQLLGVFRPSGTKREDREGQAVPSSLWWGSREQTELRVSPPRCC